jgi:hypothetical protein
VAGVLLIAAGLLKTSAIEKLGEWIPGAAQGPAWSVGVLAALLIGVEIVTGVAAFLMPRFAAPFLLVLFSVFLATHLAAIFGLNSRHSACPCLGDVELFPDVLQLSTAMAVVSGLMVFFTLSITVEETLL